MLEENTQKVSLFVPLSVKRATVTGGKKSSFDRMGTIKLNIPLKERSFYTHQETHPNCKGYKIGGGQVVNRRHCTHFKYIFNIKSFNN